MRLTTLALATTAAAAAVPGNSPTSKSAGFRLLAKVLDPSHDLTPSVNDWLVTSAHTGAAQAVAVLTALNNPEMPGGGRIFYQNGTIAQIHARQTTIISDGGIPAAPYGISVPQVSQGGVSGLVSMNVGPGSFNTVETKKGKPVVVNGLGEGTWLACEAEIPYYPGREFVTLQYLYGKGSAVPEGCVGIELVPQCAVLNELPEGSFSSHEFAAEVKCYN